MATLNPVQVMKNLNKFNYPVSKEDLIKHAEQKGIDDKILWMLKHLPEQQYETLGDVSKAIAKSE